MAVEVPQYEYQFEVETILTQFIALIDNAIVMRYDKNHETGERTLRTEIKPHYVFGPKARILYQLVNKSKNYTLPLIAIQLKSIRVDKERMADKLNRVTRYYDGTLEGFARPIPITIDVQVSAITKYATDSYQLFGKIATQFTPYCVYSWAVPAAGNMSYEELRNKAEWDLSWSFEARDKLTETDEDKSVASGNFSIQGWLFPDNKGCEGNIILDIGTTVIPLYSPEERIIKDENDYNTEGVNNPLVDVYEKETGQPYLNKREFAHAHPVILKGYVNKKLGKNDYYFSLRGGDDETVKVNRQKHTLRLNGYNLGEETKVMISAPKGLQTEQPYTTVNFKDARDRKLFRPYGTMDKKKSTIYGYLIEPKEQSQNNITIDLSDFDYSGEVDIYVYNSVDYDAVSFVLGKKITLV